MTATATGVKKIAVTFNKAVDKTTVLNLTKGTAKPAVNDTVWNEAGTEATINLAGKLTKGTYTVATTVSGDALTADVVVEKDETLTSFELVGTTFKADATAPSKAAIEYKALNQYGDAMTCSTAKPTVAPGTADDANTKTPTASSNGKIGIKDIPDIYRIAGSEFSVVIVDSATGVTLNTKAVYGASAKAKTAESVGLYNTSKAKFMDMTAGDKVANYEALFTVTDQYGDPYEVKDDDIVGASKKITAVAASGLTNVKVNDTWTTAIREVDGKKYFSIPLKELTAGKATAVAGTFSLTIVNNETGVIGTPSYTVAENVTISSIDISADAIYGGQDNTMTLTVTDTQGNTVTSYDVLKKIEINVGSANGKLKMSKNPDGTAKLVYEAPKVADGLKSEIESFTVMANEITSSNYLVKTFTFTRLAVRKAVAVVGVSSKVANSTAVSGKGITLKFTDLLIEDQYGNVFSEAELKGGKLVSKEAIFATSGALGATASTTAALDKWVVSGGAVDTVSGTAFDKDLIFTAPATHAAIKDIEINLNVAGNTNDGYKFKLSKVAQSDLAKITDLTIDSVNDGYAVHVTNGSLSVKLQETAASAKNSALEIPVVVSGKVNGKKVFITASEADTSISAPKFAEPVTAADVKNEKATVKVIVNTSDGPVTLTKEFDVSNEATGSAIAIKKDTNYATSSTTGAIVKLADVNADAAITTKPYKAVDKYGNTVTADAGSTTYTVTLKDVCSTGTTTSILKTLEAGTDYVIDHNGMHSASFEAKTPGDYTINVVVTAADGTTVEYDLKVKKS